MNTEQFITMFMEHYQIDTLLNLLVIYYLFKVANVAAVLAGNIGEALMQIYHAFKEEK